MAVPKTKPELLQQSQTNYDKLSEFVDSFSKKEQQTQFPPGTMNRNIRDVLAHLHHWHLMFLNWYEVGMKGGKPDMPAKGYSWKDTKKLNCEIHKQYRDHPLDEIRLALEETHQKMQDVIKKHNERELFEKKQYHWTGSSSLATYIRANTSSHYKWAYELIRKAKN